MPCSDHAPDHIRGCSQPDHTPVHCTRPYRCAPDKRSRVGARLSLSGQQGIHIHMRHARAGGGQHALAAVLEHQA